LIRRTLASLGGVGVAALIGSACANVAGLNAPDTNPAAQHCIDGVRDADEQDVDCGGKDCLACGGAPCTTDADCESNTCANGACKVPTCSDGVFDGYESWLDCGDPRGMTVSCSLCGTGVHCFNGCNCQSAYCDPGTSTCTPSPNGALNCDYCKDGVLDGDESDVDCGGVMSKCPGCAAGKHCSVATDCASMLCKAGVCG